MQGAYHLPGVGGGGGGGRKQLLLARLSAAAQLVEEEEGSQQFYLLWLHQELPLNRGRQRHVKRRWYHKGYLPSLSCSATYAIIRVV